MLSSIVIVPDNWDNIYVGGSNSTIVQIVKNEFQCY